MLKFLAKPYRWAVLYSVLLAVACAGLLLDAFVIPRAMAQVEPAKRMAEEQAAERPVNTTAPRTTPEEEASSGPVVTANSYADEHIRITIETVRAHDTTMYVADIQLTNASYLKTALANDTFGRNIKQTTSEMAEANQAVLGINGDYYGFRDRGYVLRNGVLYRDTDNGEGLVIDYDGNFFIIKEAEVSASTLLESGAWQVFSFGPALVSDYQVVVDTNSEVSQSQNSNPRTAIGQVSPLHYLIIVSDGRTKESKGLSLLALAQAFAERGCSVAYNLDGGGSSSMVFLGEVVNQPTNGRSAKEREVSDIVYIGYE